MVTDILPRIGPGSYPAFTIQSPLSPRLLLSPTFTMQRFNSLGLLLYVSQYKGRDVLLAPHTSQNLTINLLTHHNKIWFQSGPLNFSLRIFPWKAAAKSSSVLDCRSVNDLTPQGIPLPPTLFYFNEMMNAESWIHCASVNGPVNGDWGCFWLVDLSLLPPSTLPSSHCSWLIEGWG